ncbi:unnamed protein product [Prorocentrum cordatum]|uniref:ELMO domain-containing protein n=1 Tax=Prorocentrum cordatum TaxID=2364126 RepID=A0ABN9SX46_9DINO|nr:unnamed protein product [Polarella glacialis]
MRDPEDVSRSRASDRAAHAVTFPQRRLPEVGDRLIPKHICKSEELRLVLGRFLEAEKDELAAARPMGIRPAAADFPPGPGSKMELARAAPFQQWCNAQQIQAFDQLSASAPQYSKEGHPAGSGCCSWMHMLCYAALSANPFGVELLRDATLGVSQGIAPSANESFTLQSVSPRAVCLNYLLLVLRRHVIDVELGALVSACRVRLRTFSTEDGRQWRAQRQAALEGLQLAQRRWRQSQVERERRTLTAQPALLAHGSPPPSDHDATALAGDVSSPPRHAAEGAGAAAGAFALAASAAAAQQRGAEEPARPASHAGSEAASCVWGSGTITPTPAPPPEGLSGMLGRLSSVKLFEETPPGTLAPRDLPRLLDRTPHRLLKSPPVRASPKDSSKGSSKSSSKSSSTSRAQRRRAHQPGDAAADASGGGGSVHDPFDHDGEMQSLPSQDDAWDPDSSKRSSLAQVDAGAPILEEEDEEDDPRESGVCVSDLGLELWEEWRAEFPLEVLNSLAEFYEGCEVQEDGSRAACLGRVGEAISGALALGREAVDQEAAARGLVLPAPPPAGVARGGGGVQPAAPPGGEPEASASEDLQRWGRLLSFATLPGLLDLARGAVCRVEKDDPRRLWSADALLEVQLIFRRNMNALQRLPVAQLFQVLGSLGLEVLRADSVETQRWLVDVTKEVVHDRGTRASKLGVGSISFQEFLQIATVALREKERQRRRAAFQLEQAAWRAAGFRLLEAEDLRELHSAFVAAAENDSTAALSPVTLVVTLNFVLAATFTILTLTLTPAASPPPLIVAAPLTLTSTFTFAASILNPP